MADDPEREEAKVTREQEQARNAEALRRRREVFDAIVRVLRGA